MKIPFLKKKVDVVKLFDTRPQETVEENLARQIAEKQAAVEQAEASPDLAPATLEGLKRKYHYKGVSIRVRWEYGGRYGKTLKDLGVKRGDQVVLVPEPIENDPESVSVYWNSTLIGYMVNSRMRGMVADWYAAQKPVLAYVNGLYEWFDILLDVAFYGYVPKKD